MSEEAMLTLMAENRKLRAEIDALKHNLEVVRENHRSLELHCANREALLQSLIGLRNEQTTEIAALREAVRLAYITRGHKEDGTRTLLFRADAGVDWHFDLSADSVNAAFRALEEQP